MNKKKILVCGIVALIVVIGVVFRLTTINKSSKIKFDNDYKSLVGIKVNSEIILVIGKNNKVNNILFLNKNSINTFANQKIEGNTLDKAIELIVDKLKNKNEFNNGEKLYLTKYKDDSIYSKVEEYLNKEFVIYGVDNKIIKQVSSIDKVVMDLKIKNRSSELENVKAIYDYSINSLKSYK